MLHVITGLDNGSAETALCRLLNPCTHLRSSKRRYRLASPSDPVIASRIPDADKEFS